MLNNLQNTFSGYKIKQIEEPDYSDVFQLFQSNPYYFSKEQNHPVTFQECVDSICELPPNTAKEKKHFIGFYEDSKLIAVLDYVDDYPSKDIVFIGLFMVHGTKHRTGIGTKIINLFLSTCKQNHIHAIKLAVIAENEVSFSFWSSFGFTETGRTVTKKEGRKDWNLIVMQKIMEQ